MSEVISFEDIDATMRAIRAMLVDSRASQQRVSVETAQEFQAVSSQFSFAIRKADGTKTVTIKIGPPGSANC